MLLALAIAFIPLAVVSTGLFLSGYQPQDFDTNLRYALLGIWLVFLFSVDKVARLKVWLRVPLIPAEQSGEYLTIFAFSALLAALKLNSGMTLIEIILTWGKAFLILLVVLTVLHALFSAVRRSWRRAKARAHAKQDANG